MFLKAKLLTTPDARRNILNKSLMGGNSTAEAVSATNSSNTMATRVPIASAHSQSSVASTYLIYECYSISTIKNILCSKDYYFLVFNETITF